MKTIFKIITMFWLMVSYSEVAKSSLKDDLQQCMITASDYNNGLPMSVGNGVTVNGIGCKEEENRVVLFYNSTIDASKSNIKSVTSLRSQRTTTACTSPKMRELLNFYDMEWIYYGSNSAFMGSIKVKKEHCQQ